MSHDDPYANVAFGGPWVDQARDGGGVEAALAVLRGAIAWAFDEDIRGDDVDRALEFLSARGDRTSNLVREFKLAMNIENAEDRESELRHVLALFEQRFGSHA